MTALRNRKLYIAAAVAAVFIVLSVAALPVLDRLSPPDLSRYHDTSPVVLDRNGEILRAFTVEDGIWRLPVAYGDVAENYIKQLVVFEDKRYWTHGGVDPLALLRAVFQAAAGRRIVSGGSTLTMQTARLLEPRPRTIPSKLIEIFRAVQLERRYNKEEILQIYLTLAPFGGNLEGVRAASLAYFGKEPQALTPAEAALLVALPQSPTARRPDLYPDRARAARNRVLQRVLPEDIAREALGDPVPQRRNALPFHAPHLAQRLVTEDRGMEKAHFTYIDRSLQSALETLVENFAAQLPAQVSAAVLVTENESGRVTAYIGSAGFFDERRSGQVDAVTALRSPGSALKPFIYGIAFQDRIAHPSTMVYDGPSLFGGWAPRNFMREFTGDVTVAEALQESLNVPAVKLLDGIGPARFAAILEQAGAPLVFPGGAELPSLPVALGGAGIRLESLALLYTAVARGGDVRRISYRRGETEDTEARPFLSEEAAGWLTQILAGIERPAGFLPESFSASRIAFKTGTSYGFRDALSVGFSAAHTVAVWVGRPDGAPHEDFIGLDAAGLMLKVFDRLRDGGFEDESSGLKIRGYGDAPAALRRYPLLSLLSPAAAAGGENFRILFPPQNAMLSVDQSGGGYNPVILEAGAGRRPLTWMVNGRPQGISRLESRFAWHPHEPGAYRITAIDATGAHDSVDIWLSE